MSEKYEPELGQLAFGQPFKEYKVSSLLLSALDTIRTTLDLVMWNIHQVEYQNPFDNTGASFKCDVFEVNAYNWSEKFDQPFNFKWRDVEVSWYKYLHRGTSVNREVSNDEIAEMLDECLKIILAMNPKVP